MYLHFEWVTYFFQSEFQKINKKHDDISKLNQNMARLEADYQSSLSEKLNKIEKLASELDSSNNKVA